jgi:hypothetical protein
MAIMTTDEHNYLKKIKAKAEYEAQKEALKEQAVIDLKTKDDEKTAIQEKLKSDIAIIQSNIDSL